MTQPSKGVAVFLALFGLPFLGGGLAFIYAQIVSRGNFKTGDLIVGILFASVFVFIGAGLIYAAISGYERLKKQAACEESNPSSPWLWRQDWAIRRAESQNKNSQITYWVFCILCNLIILPVVGKLVPQMVRAGDPRVFLLLGFSSISVILFVAAMRATIRHQRFGNTYFEFDSLPFSPGRRVGGRIHLKLETQANHGIDLRLSCVRKVVSGSGNGRSTSQIVLWQADKNVPAGAVSPGPIGRAIPVDFSISADSPVTDHDNSSDQVLWLLHAQADVPGVDYSDDFELPVFRTAESEASARESQSAADPDVDARGFATTAQSDSDTAPAAQPADARVIVSARDGGTEFYFPPLRNPGRALLLFGVTLLWSGIVYLLYLEHAPIFFFIAFGLSDLFIVWGFFHVALGTARIGVSNGEIRSRSGIFAMGSARRFAASDVASIVPVVSMQQGGNSGNALYLIRMRTKDGRKFTLADEISSRQEARWVVSQIESLAGLKLDTHVEVDLPLGVPAQPPFQPGGQGRVVNKLRQGSSTPASIAVFFVIVIAMFGWVSWRSFAVSPRTSSARAASASRSNPVARRDFSAAMTDADVARLRAIPAQDQAEELLERAIGHDRRALELLEQQAGEWTGHIQMSERMKQLDRRSQFSNDLRVRSANADINLALQGWQKNKGAADLLLGRARTDQRYRAWAVYYLGMLAGRGVDYDRIHAELWNYARCDQDATVRQWAVEGMRFLGKDEVLDELFVSFTEDPSMSVRNRAGCNISDCGIFTRKQRMRMVPKFLDLAMNSRTTPQMRNWCFLALREITDENLPADAVAWSRWYQDHGPEKLAEFQRLDWWQVRGGE
ncbi:MAG TPA: hypothetical protein VFN26_17810 [Candidatus Acidoferrum sp.]|nr:hypothetical protein [Candidatus Acidoferrum sp.]